MLHHPDIINCNSTDVFLEYKSITHDKTEEIVPVERNEYKSITHDETEEIMAVELPEYKSITHDETEEIMPVERTKYKSITHDETEETMPVERNVKQKQLNYSMIFQKRNIDKIYLSDIAVVTFFHNMLRIVRK